MFRNKVSHPKPKKDEVTVNMVLVVKMRSQNPRLVLQQEKEPKKTNIVKNCKRTSNQSSNKCKYRNPWWKQPHGANHQCWNHLDDQKLESILLTM